MSENLMLAMAIVAIIVIVLPIAFGFTRFLGAKSDNERKNEPYESGVRLTEKDPFDSFNVRFFLVGIIFLLFDVEILFMFPWAVNLRELGFFGMMEMFAFMGLLIAGLVYVYRSKVLKWI